ncbi:MAG: hypothetical protein QXU26_02625 [Thermofilaceae archaeon]
MESVPIVAQYNSLPTQVREEIRSHAAFCRYEEFASALRRGLGREVSEAEARYLYVTLNPSCAGRKGSVLPEVRPVRIDAELDFLYSVVRRRIIMAIELEESQGIPLSLTDRMLEVALSILELKSKLAGQSSVLEEFVREVERAVSEDGGGEG